MRIEPARRDGHIDNPRRPFRRLGHTVELVDHPATRGMIHKVRHLVEVEE